MKQHSTKIIVASTIILSVGLIWWARGNQQPTDQNVISNRGLHSHPELAIFVKGEPIEIPQSIGLNGAAHNPIHTHDDVPVVHLEFESLVTREDTRLGEFFKVWGKDFREFGQNVTMTVNGKESTEYENYEMQDGDKIELRYE